MKNIPDITPDTFYRKLRAAGLEHNSGSWDDYPTALAVIRKLNLRGGDILHLAWEAVYWLGLVDKSENIHRISTSQDKGNMVE